MHILDAEKYAQYRSPRSSSERNFGSFQAELRVILLAYDLTNEERAQICALAATSYTQAGYDGSPEFLAKRQEQLVELHRILDTGIEVI